jgi:preprotein translocase subunit SecA
MKISKIMESLNISREEAIKIIKDAARDPAAFKQRQALIEHIRMAIDKTRSLKGIQLRQTRNAVGRNDPCPCGSGKKFKNCVCYKKGKPVGVIVHREPEND